MELFLGVWRFSVLQSTGNSRTIIYTTMILYRLSRCDIESTFGMYFTWFSVFLVVATLTQNYSPRVWKWITSDTTWARRLIRDTCNFEVTIEDAYNSEIIHIVVTYHTSICIYYQSINLNGWIFANTVFLLSCSIPLWDLHLRLQSKRNLSKRISTQPNYPPQTLAEQMYIYISTYNIYIFVHI